MQIVRRTAVAAACLSMVFSASAQTEASQEQVIEKIQCVNFFEIPALGKLAEESQEFQDAYKTHARKSTPAEIDETNSLPQGGDPVRQTEYGQRGASATSWVNVAGQGGGFPPDPSGAAGPNQYVQAVNTKWRVYNLEGDPISSSLNLNSIWPGSTNDGDPIVMYDEFADRWFISQFKGAGGGTPGVLIAISQTPDPEGEYYGYEYNLSSFPDYPKYSVWADAYYMTANSGNDNALAFEREKMIAGDPTASMIDLNFPNVANGGFRSPLPADADGSLPPVGTPNYMVVLQDDAWGGVSDDHIKIVEMSIDWENPNSSSIAVTQQINTESFDSVFTGPWNDIEQPNSTQRLDAVALIFYYRAQYRRWVGYNTLVLTHVVDLGGLQAGIRWYELRDNDDGVWSIYQQGTFAPDDDESRWMASAAMDDQGNIGMAYSVAGPNTSAGLRFTGRMANDPLGMMTYAEQTIIEGTGAQNGGNRYGDYAHMSVIGSRFWFTGEYLVNGNGRTRIFSFDLDGSTDVNDIYGSKIDTKVYMSDANTLFVDVNNLESDKQIVLDLFDIKGNLIQHMDVNPTNGSFNRTFNTAGLAKGVYMVRFGNINFQEVKKVSVN